jgi:hypothetical protein
MIMTAPLGKKDSIKEYNILWNHYESWGSNFDGFRGSLKPQKLKSNEIQFSHWLLLVVFDTPNIFKYQWITAFKRTTKAGTNEYKYFDSNNKDITYLTYC